MTNSDTMTPKEIQDILKEAANFKIVLRDGRWSGHGSINNFDCCSLDNGMSILEYEQIWYPEHKKMLESLPWTKVIELPRMPKQDEYPAENGVYLTMLDCDEHAIFVNEFRDGHWLVYDCTHVKWWMPLPFAENDLSEQNSDK